MKTLEIPVDKLFGPALDWAVAKAEGYEGRVETTAYISMKNSEDEELIVAFPQERADRWESFRPHKCGNHAIPIIERERIALVPDPLIDAERRANAAAKQQTWGNG